MPKSVNDFTNVLKFFHMRPAADTVDTSGKVGLFASCMASEERSNFRRVTCLASALRHILLLIFFLSFNFALHAQRPLGTDVSGHQPNIDWVAVKNAGVTFAWTKATEGSTFVNDYFTTQELGAKAAGIYIGAYHFARPSKNPNLTGANSAQTEAAFFWSVVGNYIKNGRAQLIPMLDWEDENATNGYPGFTTAYMSSWVNQWCNTVSNYARLNGATIRPIIYTGTWYSNPANGYPGLNTTVTNWPSWISYYPNNPNAQSGAPNSTFPWSTWTIWQYADTNWSGGDSDVFNGTAAGLASLVMGGLNAPYIISQPVNYFAIDTGNSLNLSMVTGGNAPLHYQWQLNGTNILDATNATLAIDSVQLTDAGNYTLIVTNNIGATTSEPVSVMVYPPQAIVFSDNFDTNSAASWNVNKSSSDTSVTFNFDYSALGIPAAPHSTGGTHQGVQMKANLSASAVSALSISPKNLSFSGDYRLHFDGWINVNGPFPGGGAGSTEFLTAGIGTSGTRTEWSSNPSADGYYFSVDGDGGVSASSTTSGDYCAFAGPTLQATDSGIYRAGTDGIVRDNVEFYYNTLFPNGQMAPASQRSSYAQQTGTLSKGTFGFAWHDVVVSKRGSTVDWVVDGVRLATMSNATFTANNVFVGFWDPFSSTSDNNNLSFGLVDNLRVEVPAVAPVITTNPQPQIVKLGTNVTFTAAASGLPAPSFQWLFNGTNILGMTNATFAIAHVAMTNAGNYSVIASNVAGTAASSSALLSLVPPTPAQFQVPTIQSDGTVQIQFTGDAYWTYVIETSTNLMDWSVVTNLTSANGTFEFNGTATNAPQLFYRARVSP